MSSSSNSDVENKSDLLHELRMVSKVYQDRIQINVASPASIKQWYGQRIMQMEEDMIRESLIRLGWTPPSVKTTKPVESLMLETFLQEMKKTLVELNEHYNEEHWTQTPPEILAKRFGDHFCYSKQKDSYSFLALMLMLMKERDFPIHDLKKFV